MSENTEQTPATPQRPKPRSRGAGISAIAIAVAIIALLLAAWSAWQLNRARHAEASTQQQFTAQLTDLESQLATAAKHGQAGTQRIGALETEIDDLRSGVKDLGLRTTNIETALTTLSGQQQSAHDTVLLDDIELLLRTGEQRYTLFHDAGGALKAYSQAIALLGQVQDPAYAPVRVSASTERDALAAAAPPTRQSTLDTLSTLRGEVATLPLATPGSQATQSTAKRGFWSRMAHSFSGIVRVSRENGDANTPSPDAGFARQALALDLAQAQEALLAFDAGTSRDALKRADKLLATQFDGDDAAVKSARAQVDELLAQPAAAAAPQLGGALAQLRSLRASQPPTPPPPPASTPAPTPGGKHR
ncbi:MAG TPA: uroporphyrinogen-III C-methyltransferase [Rhodanobacteraceae bacterium]|jgi:uroporphyrin-3 C-methyltransferase|nr:uroporphyrinogen-III C-methyltransferase [Rhodanobacteraceae bacterium]